MYPMGAAGRDTESLGRITFQNPGLRIIGGEIGNTTPVASELSDTAAFPNPLYGAQPAEEASAFAAEAPAPVPQRLPIQHAEGPAAPYDANFEWSARVHHAPKAEAGWAMRVENAFGKMERVQVEAPPATETSGTLIADTYVANISDPSNAPREIRDAGSKTHWYNPADMARQAWIKLGSPEKWTRRARVGAVLGSLATSAVGAVMMYHGIKNGVDHGGLLHMLHGNKTTEPTNGTPVGDWHAPEAAHQVSPDNSGTPELHQPAPQPTPQPTEVQPTQSEPEHFRVALTHDAHTDRASNVTDWSVAAIRDAAKQAGLSAAETNKLAHNHHDIQLVNHAFYGDNARVAHDGHHLLYAETKYTISGQETAARDIVHHWQTTHQPHATDTGTPVETSPMPSSTELPANTDPQSGVPSYQTAEADPTVVPQPSTAPTPEPEHFMGLSADEIIMLQSSLAALGAGTLATAGTVAYKARHRAKIQAVRQNEWGGLQSHREGTYQGKHHEPTIPAHVDPRQYWRMLDREKLRLKREQDAEKSEPATV